MTLPPHPPPTDGPLTAEELALATRNRGMLLEALRYDITPVGMHYLLVHFDVPAIDPSTYRLAIGGLVERPVALDLEAIRALPRVTQPVTLECAGNGRARLVPRPISQPWLVEGASTAMWTGTPLRGVLEACGVQPGALEVVFVGADHGIERGHEHDFARSLTLAEALRDEMLLAYEMNGRPLEPQHGAPLRLIAPGWYGMAHVKWLARIELVDRAFDGYQQKVAYHFRRDADDPGTPITRIKPRALLEPPGFPDFMSRTRIVERGAVTISGRAWCGASPIARVELGVDDRWHDATLEAPLGPYAWRRWHCPWTATPGEHVLSCRATAADGTVQPVEPPWNYGGSTNNTVQRVPVIVR